MTAFIGLISFGVGLFVGVAFDKPVTAWAKKAWTFIQSKLKKQGA